MARFIVHQTETRFLELTEKEVELLKELTFYTVSIPEMLEKHGEDERKIEEIRNLVIDIHRALS